MEREKKKDTKERESDKEKIKKESGMMEKNGYHLGPALDKINCPRLLDSREKSVRKERKKINKNRKKEIIWTKRKGNKNKK